MVDNNTSDRGDLWGQIQSAKENFNDGFSQKYGSPPVTPTEATGKSTLEKKLEPQSAVPSQQQPAISNSDNTGDKALKVASGNFTSFPAKDSQAMASHTSNSHPAPRSTPAPSTPTPLSGVSQYPRTQPQPCIPLTRTETPSKTPKDTKPIASNRLRRQVRCIPLRRPQPAPHTPPVSSLARETQASSSAPTKSSKSVQTTVSSGKTQITTVKMTESDDADEVLLYKRRANNPKVRDGHQTYKALRRDTSLRDVFEPAHKFVKRTALNNTDDRRISQVSVWTEGLHKGIILPSDDQFEGTSTPSLTAPMEKDRGVQVEDPMNELARLQKEALLNAHRGAGNDPSASPEMLARCRDGPGTDQRSKEYFEIAEMRAVPRDSVPDPNCYPEPFEVFSAEPREDATPELLERERNGRLKLYRELYKKSSAAFPMNGDENEKMVFSPTPTARHQKALSKIRQGRRELTPQPIDERESPARCADKKVAGTEVVQVFDNSWTDPAIVDWEYCPRYISDEIPYRAWFQNWLERSITCECQVDIFHETFFNGTAHADGETSMMFILDMRHYETLLDPADEASLLHAHETSAGYCYNVNLQNKVADEAEEHRKLMEREARLQARRRPLRGPSSPVANIYLWYARNSFDSPNTHDLSEDEVRERIEKSDRANLPFIVAIDRQSVSSRSEKVLGYACAREFDKHEASRFTAELEVYVKDDHTSLGIGRCLLDKLIELCDATYRPKSGFEFIPPPGDKSGYLPGGKRRLARMVITLGHVDENGITRHKRLKKWLRDCAEFEEQGVLRGVREKNGDLINVTYLVRRAGHSLSNKLGS
ncbi:uncharacterized protein BDV17DRAFT_249140 [Aspergillus undulatus]|uniref:uncharacterized protein n=1 Tax=Aspergillus undulatus TaxID=1810928 RepID=UPI003CCE4368